jgi:hypothetical protein
MELQTILVLVVLLSQIAIGIPVFLLWKRTNSKPDSNPGTDNRLWDELRTHLNRASNKLDVIENRLLDKVESIKDLIRLQSSFTSYFPERREEIRETTARTKELVENDFAENNFGRTPPVNITPRVRSDGTESRLESLLNGSEFLQNFWQNKMSKRVDECQTELIKFLAEHGQPEPEFEIYPPLQDNNPHHWHFLIVQTRGTALDKKRFVIPRHYDRFDPLRHSHLFQVRGSSNKPENFVLELHRCAILSSGKELSGYIDKSLVEKQGIISLV